MRFSKLPLNIRFVVNYPFFFYSLDSIRSEPELEHRFNVRFTGKQLCQSFFLINEKRFRKKCFPVSFRQQMSILDNGFFNAHREIEEEMLDHHAKCINLRCYDSVTTWLRRSVTWYLPWYRVWILFFKSYWGTLMSLINLKTDDIHHLCLYWRRF